MTRPGATPVLFIQWPTPTTYIVYTLTRLTDANSEPVPLKDFKTHSASNTGDDDRIKAYYLRAARNLFEQQTAYIIGSQTWQLTVDQFSDLLLPLRPVTSIASVTYRDSDTTSVTLTEGTDYFTNLTRQPAVITFPTIPGTVAEHRRPLVTVTFAAGTTEADQVPDEVKVWILQVATTIARNRESHGDTPLTELPFVFKALAANFVLPSVGGWGMS